MSARPLVFQQDRAVVGGQPDSLIIEEGYELLLNIKSSCCPIAIGNFVMVRTAV